MPNVFIPYSSSIIKAVFIERPNRFLIRCQLVEKGDVIEAHLPDSDRLKELLIQGRELYLLPNSNPARKTKFSAVCVKDFTSGNWVSINATLPNKVAGLAFEQHQLSEFSSWTHLRGEYSKGNSRWDHLLEKDGEYMVVEVKGVTLVNREGTGFFPDAVTSRGTKHVRELSQIAKEPGWHAAILFVAQRSDIKELQPAAEIDPDFANALLIAKRAGVTLSACRCHVTPDGMRLLDQIPVNLNI
ncbi:DNA/RNA nuclease SfsA [Salipaludibacillus sp. LMS25]|uniref:DNA/RNA nuclease SfsA n=1 Tax=Salipaludibacillus sp. LMS25 TaxID=2924031 RepID=UPI0020D0B7D6|nr:DNA/RNA nuclease SfsA [Salipaludibacillus sp. LMS25]UTR14137.1 DNA/RNA nuclease SfsA [Salipaludibacillus sp. LMS25]